MPWAIRFRNRAAARDGIVGYVAVRGQSVGTVVDANARFVDWALRMNKARSFDDRDEADRVALSLRNYDVVVVDLAEELLAYGHLDLALSDIMVPRPIDGHHGPGRMR